MQKLRVLLPAGFLVAILLSGCMLDEYERDLNAGYYMEAHRKIGQMTIGYQHGLCNVTVIGQTVSAIGQNQDYIIARQLSDESAGMPEARYYIIPLNYKLHPSARGNFYGPLTAAAFEKKKRALHISDLDFSLVLTEPQKPAYQAAALNP